MLYVQHLRDEDIDAATWDRLLAQSPGGGHALQTHAWGEFKRTQGWLPVRLTLKDGDADHTRGVALLMVRDVAGSGRIAYCAKGPWIDWSSGEQTRAMLQGMAHFARRHGAFILKIETELRTGPGLPTHVPPSLEPAIRRAIDIGRRLRSRNGAATDGKHTARTLDDGEDDKRIVEAREGLLAARAVGAHDDFAPGRAAFRDLGFDKSLWDMQNRTTMAIDLAAPEAMLARMKSKWRYNIKLAARKGVTVVEDNSQAARDILYEMHARTADRDGFVLRPRDYLYGAWTHMIDAGHGQIFLAYHEGRPLAGLLAHTFGRKAWYQVGASETEGRNLMPAHALQFHVMQWAQQRGITYYDLVAIPNLEDLEAGDAGMWGLYTFKYGFGSYPIEWAGGMDLSLDPRGHAWEFVEPAYYRLYRRRAGNLLY